ncbi:MAG: phosphatidylserine decarboxylase [Candidatus Rokubacteria bacterium]|nr:phosphatidylserine decarboxylase [Candidatus Rokubacteria bacterium]
MLPIAAAGWPFILVPLALALGAWGAGWPKTGLALGLLAGFMAFFFRDPERHPPGVPGAVLAPADGRVTEVREPVEDPFVGRGRQISIFLSPLDVHVNRSPIAALVADVQYRPGAFRPAYRAEASELNERNTIALQGQEERVVVRQIAGVLARRIVCRLRPGDKVAAGERIGLIRFGSRVDLVVPWSVTPSVRVGDRVRAGETVVGVVE